MEPGHNRYRAVVFDVDGTLYRAGPVRRGMLLRLALAYGWRPWAGWRVLGGIAAYRRAQEELRARGPEDDLAEAQLVAGARARGVPRDELAGWVERWMEHEPLDLVARAARPGLAELLAALRGRGAALGVLSDYPPHAKLEALGVAGAFDAVHWAQEAAVGRFKPDPAGLLAVVGDLGLEPPDVLYVGDRHEVDGEVAARAGTGFAHVDDWAGLPDAVRG